MNWTPPMSAMMLKGLSEVAARGAKTDKGFKEVAKLKVAKCISSLVGYDVSIANVHNHIRKWRNRWTRTVYLKGLSGALWDDEKKMVLLEEQHYLGHTLLSTSVQMVQMVSQDHPTDAELINSPLEYYNYMELCFANKHATGIYSMGTSVPLRTPIVVEDKDKPNVREGQGITDEVLQDLPGSNFALRNASATQDPSPISNKKRKRSSGLTKEDSLQCSNMTNAMREIASAINNTCHAETHPDLYKAIMDLTMFDQNERLAILDYLTEHKAKGLYFMKMDEEVRQASFKHILKENPDLL
uniref:Myb/SANT-like domain-containing protein n=2 Tax=Hordeum vulgare subsp. vulgare TaxID=112509 RepID=A0A8I6YAZ4_HORVV